MVTKTETQTPQIIILHAHCAYCTAPGAYAAMKGTQMVTFCGHHAREHETGLLAKNFTLYPDSPQFKKAT